LYNSYGPITHIGQHCLLYALHLFLFIVCSVNVLTVWHIGCLGAVISFLYSVIVLNWTITRLFSQFDNPVIHLALYEKICLNHCH